MTYVLPPGALARVLEVAAGWKGSQSGSIEDEHHFLFDCPAYRHISLRSDYSKLFQHPAPTVASFLATEQLECAGQLSQAMLLTDILY